MRKKVLVMAAAAVMLSSGFVFAAERSALAGSNSSTPPAAQSSATDTGQSFTDLTANTSEGPQIVLERIRTTAKYRASSLFGLRDTPPDDPQAPTPFHTCTDNSYLNRLADLFGLLPLFFPKISL